MVRRKGDIRVEEFIQESEARQSGEMDTVPPDFKPNWPGHLNVSGEYNSTEELLKCFYKLTEHDQIIFQKQYGNLGELLKIPVQAEGLRALVRYWDPIYRVFSFGKVEMSPSMEEYHELLKCPNQLYRVYFFSSKDQIEDFIYKETGCNVWGEKPHIVNANASQGWYWSQWCKRFEAELENPETNEYRLKILALAIYGLVLFPSQLGLIDVYAANVFLEVLRNNINPVATILGETVTTLNFCRIKGKGRFHCCVQLLHVWMVSHLINGIRQFTVSWMQPKKTLKEFANQTWREMTEQQWAHMLESLQSTEFTWKAIWMPRESYLVRCGKFPWVPLIGARGLVSHAPALVSRQFGYEQCIPVTKGLHKYYFSFLKSGIKEVLEQAKEAWKQKKLVWQKDFKVNPGTTPEYPLWQEKRRKGLLPPITVGPKPEPEGMLKDTVTKMQMQFETREAQLKSNLKVEIRRGKRIRNAEQSWKDREEQLESQLVQIRQEYEEVNKKWEAEKLAREKTEKQMAELKEFHQKVQAHTQTELAHCIIAKQEMVAQLEDVKKDLNDTGMAHNEMLDEWRIEKATLDQLLIDLNIELQEVITERNQREDTLIDRTQDVEILEMKLNSFADHEEDLVSEVRLWRGERDRLLALIRTTTHRTRQVQRLGNRIIEELNQWTRANLIEFMNRCGALLNQVVTEWVE